MSGRAEPAYFGCVAAPVSSRGREFYGERSEGEQPLAGWSVKKWLPGPDAHSNSAVNSRPKRNSRRSGVALGNAKSSTYRCFPHSPVVSTCTRARGQTYRSSGFSSESVGLDEPPKILARVAGVEVLTETLRRRLVASVFRHGENQLPDARSIDRRYMAAFAGTCPLYRR